MPYTNQQSTLDQYCQEDGIWRNLIPYLSAADIGSLKRTCKLFNTTLDKLDVAWQPFLNQLHSIDETISVTPQRGQTIKEAFFADFEKVKTRQLAEIDFLAKSRLLPGYHFANYPRLSAIQANVNQPHTLSDVVAISAELDALNISVINNEIALTKNMGWNNLLWVSKSITRFPKELIDNPELEAFWCNLRELDLSYNFLHTLPSNIHKLQALERMCLEGNQFMTLPLSIGKLECLTELNCSYNHLISLPDSIGKLKALEKLLCPSNQLETLPSSIGELQALTNMSFSCNQLIALPDSIGKLKALKMLWCDENQLKTLPSSIGELQALTELDFRSNKLIALPASLTTRFGQQWATFTLAIQRRPVEQSPVVEDVAPTLLVKRNLDANQSAKRQRISPREIDSLKLDERWLPAAEKRNNDGKQSLPKRRK